MTETSTEHRTIDSEPATSWLRRAGRSNLLVFLAWFALILVLKWPTLTQPPVWDGSMSVFPAAITLAENGFDLGYLLEQPGYPDGGPNVHSISLVTWLTAAVIAVVGTGPSLFPVLHVIHFFIAAFAFTGLYRLSEPAFGRVLAAATCLTALAVPVVLTQVGFMYLEVALLATAVHAVLALQRNRIGRAATFATAAVLIKGSGLFLAGALALAVLFTQRRWPEKIRSAALLVAPPTFLSFFLFGRAAVEDTFTYGIFRWETSWYLRHIPDVMLLLLLFTVAAVVSFRRDSRQPSASRLSIEPAKSVLASAALVVLAFLGFFFVALPLAGRFFSVLPRYYTVVVPFAVLGLAAVAHRMRVRAIAFAGLAVLLAFSIVNRNGVFYADNDHENFALIERSGAYLDLLELQRKGTVALALAGQDVPIFYSHADHYRLSYPEMGYAEKRPMYGFNLKTDQPYAAGNLRDFPDSFVMLYEWNWLGGEVAKLVWEQALLDPSREVEERVISVGSFSSTLISVSTRDG